jgi:hypothetical protein
MQVLSEPTVPYGSMTGKAISPNLIPLVFSDSSIFLGKKNHFSVKISELIQKLQRLKTLKSNWDGYQADAPSLNSINLAQSFLIDNHALSLPYYFLAPGVNGEVMIEFKQENRAAELFFLENGNSELILFENDEVVFEGNIKDHFLKLLQFFNPK